MLIFISYFQSVGTVFMHFSSARLAGKFSLSKKLISAFKLHDELIEMLLISVIKVPLTIFEGGLLLKFIRIFHSDSAMWIYRQSFPLHPNAQQSCRFLLSKGHSKQLVHRQRYLHLLQVQSYPEQAPDE